MEKASSQRPQWIVTSELANHNMSYRLVDQDVSVLCPVELIEKRGLAKVILWLAWNNTFN
jgi:hypothetical protein